MAVAFNALGTARTSGATTSLTSDFTTLTIGSVSNPCVILAISFGANPGAFTKQQWDSTGTPITLTNIISANESDNLGYAFLFGAPVGSNTGNKHLALTWTNSVDWACNAVSFSGVDQTGGATTFKNTATNTASGSGGNPYSITVTSPSGDMAVANFASNLLTWSTAATGTLIYSDNTNVSGAGIYLAGSGSTVLTMNSGGTGTDPTCAVGCDIAASGVADILMSQACM